MKKLALILFLLLLGTAVCRAQKFDSTKTVTITLTDDTEITGKIIAGDSVNTTIRTLMGIVSVVPNKKIAKVEKLKGSIVRGEYYPPDPSDNRLLLMPTARPLKMGETQFNAVEVFFPHLIFGVTDFINLGLGGMPFVANGGGTFVYYLSAKITPVNVEQAALSVGGAMIGVTESKALVGIGYAFGTFGTKTASFTIGPLFGFSGDEVFDRPAFLLGGSARLSKAASFISENIFLFGNDTKDFTMFPSIGIRFAGEHLAADFGTYAVIAGDDFFYPIPWIGLSYKF